VSVDTDPKSLDVAGSLDALPNLLLGRGPDADAERVRATGTAGPQCHSVDAQLALRVARAIVKYTSERSKIIN
jgi:hypothetical protein